MGTSAQILLNQSLSDTLAVGNQTGANDISVDTGQSIIFNNSSFTAQIIEPTLTGDISLTLPSSTGTIALVSDIPSTLYTGDGTLTGDRVIKMHGSSSGDTLTVKDSTDSYDILKILGDNRIEFENSTGVVKTRIYAQGGYGYTFATELGTFGQIGTANQYALKVYSRGSSSSGIANMYNSTSISVVDFRQVAGSGLIYLKNSTGATQITLNGSSGRVDSLNGFSKGGVNGFTGTGDYSNFTIEGGIITSATE